MMPPLLLKLVFTRLPQRPMPALVRPIVRRIANGVRERSSSRRSSSTWTTWRESSARPRGSRATSSRAADIQMSFPIEGAASRGGLDASRPKLLAFLERIHARPAYKRALERGGPYELLR